MATILGVACTDGAVLAGDRLLLAGGSVRSTAKRHVFDFGDVGAAAVGPGDAVDRFADLLDAEIREYRTERGDLSLDVVGRLASDVAADVGVRAVVAAHADGDGDGDADGDGVAIRAIDADGAVTDDDVAAFGSGAALVLGQLEATRGRPTVADAESLVASVFAAVSERDAGTGADFDTYVLRE